MTTYNGHPSWNAWNVSLWIGSEEWLYRAAVEAGKAKNSHLRLRRFRELTGLEPTDKTPDGGVYNNKCVLLAINGLREP
jgi:hypothetical protein